MVDQKEVPSAPGIGREDGFRLVKTVRAYPVSVDG